MATDLTASDIDQQNILNNPYALTKLQEHLGLGGLIWNSEPVFTVVQVAELLDVDPRTIERYLSSHVNELTKNGYRIIKGSELSSFVNDFATDIDVGRKIRHLGIFSFRAVLNFAMLLTESERAREIRSRMLDIVIGVMAERAGGHTKYINQRDGGYLFSSFQEQGYRKKFTSSLGKYVENFPFKYSTYTDRIYHNIFKEKSKEYRAILKLNEKENVRDTMYSEVLTLIASYENGLAHAIEKKYNVLGRKLNGQELKLLFEEFNDNPAFEPLINDARSKMASRDWCFRDALHENLRDYVRSVPEADFDRFLGEKSKALEERIAETRDVFKRLKER
jgi:hypothetical protein